MANRVAGRQVDRGIEAIRLHVARLRRSRWTPEIELALHRSVSAMLRAEVRRVESPQLVSSLPESLHRDLQHSAGGSVRSPIERLLTRRVSQWHRAVIELCDRLDDDWDALVRHFELNRGAAVSSISAPLGDFHAGGRTVYSVTFEDGRTLIYKPRSVRPEAVFGQVVAWLTQDFEPRLTACSVLPRDGYGWVDYVRSAVCTSADEAVRYHEKQGAFLALFYLLCGCDCTRENVVVCKDTPVWVDTECLCSPDMAPAIAVRSVPAWMYDSVLSTSFIFCGNDAGIPPRLMAGLNAPCVEPQSLVFAHGDVLRDRYVDAVVRGFRQAYDRVIDRQAEWSFDREPLAWCRESEFRIVPRPTWLYSSLCDLLAMTSAARRSEVTARIFNELHAQHGSRNWPEAFVQAEVRALERADIPCWVASPDSWHVREAGDRRLRVAGVVARTGIDSVHQRAARLSRHDREAQVWLIETFLRVVGGSAT